MPFICLFTNTIFLFMRHFDLSLSLVTTKTLLWYKIWCRNIKHGHEQLKNRFKKQNLQNWWRNNIFIVPTRCKTRASILGASIGQMITARDWSEPDAHTTPTLPRSHPLPRNDLLKIYFRLIQNHPLITKFDLAMCVPDPCRYDNHNWSPHIRHYSPLLYSSSFHIYNRSCSTQLPGNVETTARSAAEGSNLANFVDTSKVPVRYNGKCKDKKKLRKSWERFTLCN